VSFGDWILTLSISLLRLNSDILWLVFENVGIWTSWIKVETAFFSNRISGKPKGKEMTNNLRNDEIKYI
jgi:hypothetical protein